MRDLQVGRIFRTIASWCRISLPQAGDGQRITNNFWTRMAVMTRYRFSVQDRWLLIVISRTFSLEPMEQGPPDLCYIIGLVHRRGPPRPFSVTPSWPSTFVRIRGAGFVAKPNSEPPAIQFNFFADYDRRTLVEGVKLVRKMARTFLDYTSRKKSIGSRIQFEEDFLEHCRKSALSCFMPRAPAGWGAGRCGC